MGGKAGKEHSHDGDTRETCQPRRTLEGFIRDRALSVKIPAAINLTASEVVSTVSPDRNEAPQRVFLSDGGRPGQGMGEGDRKEAARRPRGLSHAPRRYA